ncbi:LacI family DNA-binding transcriptional regulator [Bacillus sp. AFS041924]|uniref:LacI family DNA-binding transcriptional regulator n=1 Tax=Bacillus sp. AFS041924 TaxID=2033503 RepID=UPI000BFC1083|nr:LacI family DNA-binding transcriptional regulator [Bacillus sp. AFS041924]PGS54225.1 LacI family transcriptional regulator [Bacillus sp. AFS041924]
MAITLKDISKATGFSITTVSRALNGYSDVNEETRVKIFQVADELGYSPNILARSLVMKQSKTIGFIVSDIKRESIKDQFMFEILCGVSDFLAKTEYEFVLLSTTTTKQKNKTYKQICAERQLDGVIIQGLKMNDPYLEEAVNSQTPCVLIDIPCDGEKNGFVTSNQYESAKNAVKYLIRVGHKNIAFINGTEYAHVSTVRKQAYEAAIKENRIEFREELIVNGDFEEEKAKQEMIKLLLNHPDITAVFCASDVMALGALHAARELKIAVPEQLSIIGFDNILISQYVTPKLTTIGQYPYKMGVAAANMLIDIFEGKESERVIEVKNDLILRESVATVKKGD